jgi:hypothetical protein
MIQAMGFMIGFYILTKMFMVIAPKDKPENPFVVVLAVFTVLAVIVCFIVFSGILALPQTLQYWNK